MMKNESRNAKMINVNDTLFKPNNLAHSDVLRAVEEEEHEEYGYKRVAWPPVTEAKTFREFTPQPTSQPPLNCQQPATQPAGQQGVQQYHKKGQQYQSPQQHQQQIQYRDPSPGIITLRQEAPVSQKPVPVFSSQPAAARFGGGANMRGDLKWPPAEYKAQAEAENEERRRIAQGPVCRPRRINKDYTKFFAKNALSHHYPSYKVPPGTQHMYSSF